jgi:hypothetical protein
MADHGRSGGGRDISRAVAGSVVDDDDFAPCAGGTKHADHLRDRVALVVCRDDDRHAGRIRH